VKKLLKKEVKLAHMGPKEIVEFLESKNQDGKVAHRFVLRVLTDNKVIYPDAKQELRRLGFIGDN
jgi:hypothetical protein